MRRGAVVLVLVAIAVAVAAALLRGWLRDRADPVPPGGRDTAATAAAVGGLSTAIAVTTAPTAAPTADAEGARAVANGDDPFAAQRTGYCGRVVSTGGAPVPAIDVELYRAAPDVALPPGLDVFAATPAAIELAAARARTGADGRFRLDGVLPRGICWIRLAWPDVRSAPPPLRAGNRTIVPVQRAPAPGEIVDLGDLALKNGAVLTGRVVDGDGRPLAGALVRAASLPPLPFAALPLERLRPDGAIVVTAAGRAGVHLLPPWFGKLLDALPIVGAATGPDGTFALYGVDAGTAVVAVTAPGRLSLLRQGVAVAPAATTALGDLSLGDGASAEVRVTTTAGAPVAAAEVLVAGESLALPIHVAEPAGHTDAEGRATATGLPRGRAFAAARRSARERWTIGEPGPSDGTLAVVLPDKCTLRLTVVDATGRPARDVEVQLAAGQVDSSMLELALFGGERGVDLAGRRHDEGPGRLSIDDLDRGPWRLLVTARDCGISSQQLELQGDTETTVQLRSARPLGVHVVDDSGAPVEAAAIYVQSRGGTRLERIVDLPLCVGRTDADGRCRVRDLPTAETSISASHPRYGQVHARVQGTPDALELRFLAAGAIDGRLTDGGKAPAPGRWLAVLERRYDDQRPRGAAPDMPQLAIPDLDGNFTFAALQPGSYRVTVQDSATDVTTVAAVQQYLARRKQIFPWSKADVTLHGAERLEVHIDAMLDAKPWDGPGADVRGTVTIDGAAGDGALVVGTSTPGDRRVTSRVDRGGTFDLGRCPAGALRVVVVPREVAESRLLEHLFSHHFARNVVVVDGEPLQLDIAIATGAVRGDVRDWNGAPVADCRIVLFDRGGEGHSSALRVGRTGADGAFAFAQLPAGRYELRAEREDFGRCTATTIDVAAGATTGPIAVALRMVAQVHGKLDLAGLPPGRRLLTFTPIDDGEVARQLCEEDGTFDLRSVQFGRYRAAMQLPGESASVPLGEVAVDARIVADLRLRPMPPR